MEQQTSELTALIADSTEDEHTLKQTIITEVVTNKRLLSDVARQYQLPTKTVYLWVRESEPSHPSESFAVMAEIDKLQQRIRELTAELKFTG